MKLLLRALVKLISGFAVMALLLFLPAGTWHYPGGWLFMALLFIPMLPMGAWLYFKAPALLEKRLKTDEKEKTQKGVVGFTALAFAAAFVLAGLDFRFGWTTVPKAVVIAAALVQLLSYAMYALVMKQNAYLSRTVEVQEGQLVVDSGLYGIVRHPMYSATVFMFLAMPLVLWSWLSFALMLSYPAAIVIRIKNEEKVLREGLAGYSEYLEKVKYRLIPFIW